VKSITFKKIVMDLSEDERELLAEYLSEYERARIPAASSSIPQMVRSAEDSLVPQMAAAVPQMVAESALSAEDSLAPRLAAAVPRLAAAVPRLAGAVPQMVAESARSAEDSLAPRLAAEPMPLLDGPIFVVHGHARATLHEAVRVLERATGKEVIVLHEQANAGRTILEKFENYSAEVSFAVVLLTGDDEGGIRASSETRPRGRQNVIFELGFFFGKLGRQRVVVLLEEQVERPSDIAGLVYVSLDQSGAWKYQLARELEAAGIPVDHTRIP
jgi:predicted nucleotide-binding protein